MSIMQFKFCEWRKLKFEAINQTTVIVLKTLEYNTQIV